MSLSGLCFLYRYVNIFGCIDIEVEIWTQKFLMAQMLSERGDLFYYITYFMWPLYNLGYVSLSIKPVFIVKSIHVLYYIMLVS